MCGAISGLPDEPVSETVTQALSQHAEINFCQPVYTLADNPESVIVLALGKAERVYFVYFNPESEQWEQLLETELPSAVTDDIPFDEQEVDERLAQHYDEEELAPAGYPTDPVVAAVEKFPPHPLTDDQLTQIQANHPMIGEVIPLITTATENRTIALIFFFDDFIDTQRITAATGYDPNTERWELITTVESSHSELDGALEQLEATYATWIGSRYSMDEIDPLEDPEAAIIS